MIQKAISIREQRDKLYGNIFEEVSGDLRWVGDLGEICFNQWLKQNGVLGFTWYLDNAAGKPDFVLYGKRVDVKTVKRKVPPRPDYTAQITARHKSYPIDELFFLSYEYSINKMWLLGGIDKPSFLKKAFYYKEGDRVHGDYTIRKGHEIYNAPINLLINPTAWISQLKA